MSSWYVEFCIQTANINWLSFIWPVTGTSKYVDKWNIPTYINCFHKEFPSNPYRNWRITKFLVSIASYALQCTQFRHKAHGCICKGREWKFSQLIGNIWRGPEVLWALPREHRWMVFAIVPEFTREYTRIYAVGMFPVLENSIVIINKVGGRKNFKNVDCAGPNFLYNVMFC